MRLAWADYWFREGTPTGLQRAVSILPGYSRYQLANAVVQEQVSPDSPDIERSFAAAVRLNPHNSEALMSWGIFQELSGNPARAEQLLLQAKSVDHLIKPVWTLANFYFRQGDTGKFLPAAKQCLRMMADNGLFFGGYNPASMYDLCWNITDDPHRIFRDLIPHERDVVYSYFNYLLNRGRFDQAVEVADFILKDPTRFEYPALLGYVDHLLRDHRISLAVRTWRVMAEKKLIPYEAVDPARGVFLTNGDFAKPILYRGFDWRNISIEPVRFTDEPEARLVRFEFDGDEPEHIVLLAQTTPVAPGKYSLSIRFDAPREPSFDGFTWRVFDQKNGQQLPSQAKSAVNEYGLTFEVPPGVEAVELALVYDRLMGTSRPRGSYEVRGVTLHKEG
jgi:tetratricopeptide (TPR) repeat protein